MAANPFHKPTAAERRERILALAGDDLAVMIGIDLTRGYPKVLGNRALVMEGCKAGVAKFADSGYPSYTEEKK